jgi:hypothetical protein
MPSCEWNILSADDADTHAVFQGAPIAVRYSNDGEVHSYQAVATQPVLPADFLSFLNKVAPEKVPTAGGIMADWKMPDDTDAESVRLQGLHQKGLKELWVLFEQHRRAFMRALSAVHFSEKYSERNVPFCTEDECQPDIFHSIHSKNDLVRIFQQLHHEHGSHLPLQLAAWRDVGKRKRGRRSKPVHVDFPLWTREQLKRAMGFIAQSELEKDARSIAAEIRKDTWQALNEAKATNYMQMPHPDSGKPIFIDSRYYQQLSPSILAAVNHEEFESDGFKADVSLGERNSRTLKIKMRLLENQTLFRCRMFPLLQWTRDDDGVRRWEYGSLSEADFSILQPHLHGQYEADQVDALFGLIALSRTRPDITSQWPKRMNLPNGRYPQIVGPAQLPVLVAMKEREILKDNGYLASLEEKIGV